MLKRPLNRAATSQAPKRKQRMAASPPTATTTTCSNSSCGRRAFPMGCMQPLIQMEILVEFDPRPVARWPLMRTAVDRSATCKLRCPPLRPSVRSGGRSASLDVIIEPSGAITVIPPKHREIALVHFHRPRLFVAAIDVADVARVKSRRR